MKNVLFIIMICSTTNLFSQKDEVNKPVKKEYCITMGILQGGGSLIGADLEFLLTSRIGFQVGVGIIGLGTGLNYHLKPWIKSSFFSFQYLNQGIGETFAQNIVGLTYVYRSKKWFTFQAGVGAPLNKGPALPDDYEQPPVMFLYSIGAYIPFQ